MANTKTVGASGKDYTTIAAAIGWMQANHSYTTNGIATVEVYDDSEYNESALQCYGITGSPSITAYLKIVAASGNRHVGVAGTGHCRVRGSTGGNHLFLVDQDFVWIDGFELQQDSSGSSDECVRVNNGSTGNNIVISNCILWSDTATADQDGIYGPNKAVDVTVYNCVIYGFARAGCHAQNYGGSGSHAWRIDHTSIFKCGAASEGNSGGIHSQDASSGSNTITTYNTYAGDTASTYADFAESGTAPTWAGDYNSASDATATGANAVDSVAVNTTNFTNVTGGTEDYSLPGTGSALYNVGTDRQGNEADSRLDYSLDIAGGARPTSNVDIGAFEFIAAGGATPYSAYAVIPHNIVRG